MDVVARRCQLTMNESEDETVVEAPHVRKVKEALKAKGRAFKLYVNDESLTLLAQGLKVKSTIVSLHLESSKFGLKGLSALAAALKINNSLRMLRLTSTNHASHDFEALSALLLGLSQNCSLCWLDLTDVRFADSDKATTALQQMCRQHQTLWHCSTLVGFGSELDSVFDRRRGELVKSGVFVRVAGKCLLVRLAELERLRSGSRSTANFTMLKPGVDEIKQIVVALTDNKTVTVLDLGFNYRSVNDQSLAPLLQLLKSNRTLREIRLDSCYQVTGEFLQKVKAALSGNEPDAALDRKSSAQPAVEAKVQAPFLSLLLLCFFRCCPDQPCPGP
jgi:hypothetical protein